MPSAETIYAFLLTSAAVGILAAVAVGWVAVGIVGSRRKGAVIGPTLAALFGEVLTASFGQLLRVDIAGAISVVAAFAILVAVFDELRQEPSGTQAWTLGWLGWHASIGIGQGFVIGGVAAIVAKDPRLIPLLVFVGAVLRTVWAWGNRRTQQGRVPEPAEPTPAVRDPDARPADVVASPSQARPRRAREDPLAGRALKVVVGIAVALLVGAAALAAIDSSRPDPAADVTVHNRTLVPISFSLPGTANLSVPACTTGVFDLVAREWQPRGTEGTASPVPSGAFEVELYRFVSAPADAPLAGSFEVVITKDTERGSRSYTREQVPPVPTPTPMPCAGTPRQRASFKGSSNQITPFFRLAGKYRRETTVTATETAGCDFKASLRFEGSPEVFVDPVPALQIPPGGHPSLSEPEDFPDDRYRLVIVTDCTWTINLVPS
jgi:hypothetical protein